MSCVAQCGCIIYSGILSSYVDRLPPTDAQLDLEPLECGTEFEDGRNEPRAWYIDVVDKYGNMEFYYDSFSVGDRFVLYMDGKKFFDSGCEGTYGYKKHTFYVPKLARRVWIEVRPNCDGFTDTVWKIKTECPDGRLAQNDKEILRAYRYGEPVSKDVSVFKPNWGNE